MDFLRCVDQSRRCGYRLGDCLVMARLLEPFSPAAWEMPTEGQEPVEPSPVGILPPFHALTVYRCKGGYQASLAVEENRWIVQINSDAMRAIDACFRVRFG